MNVMQNLTQNTAVEQYLGPYNLLSKLLIISLRLEAYS